jgi:hypothetical protein
MNSSRPPATVAAWAESQELRPLLSWLNRADLEQRYPSWTASDAAADDEASPDRKPFAALELGASQ